MCESWTNNFKWYERTMQAATIIDGRSIMFNFSPSLPSRRLLWYICTYMIWAITAGKNLNAKGYFGGLHNHPIKVFVWENSLWLNITTTDLYRFVISLEESLLCTWFHFRFPSSVWISFSGAGLRTTQTVTAPPIRTGLGITIYYSCENSVNACQIFVKSLHSVSSIPVENRRPSWFGRW